MITAFQPVTAGELGEIEIEVSRLTIPVPLEYADAEDLLAKLRPGVDGVILKDGPYRRATFLPQVWEKIPDTGEFLDNLCYKMGSPPDTWRRKKLDVLVYQVEEFHENAINQVALSSVVVLKRIEITSQSSAPMLCIGII